MDYVVFGIGFGATLLVLGLTFRDLGPRVRYRTPPGPDGVFHAEQLVARFAWERFCGAFGAVLAVAGAVFLLLTLTCMLLRLPDHRAPLVMGIAFVMLALVLALWTWAFFDRFGSYGILPEREVPSTSRQVMAKSEVVLATPSASATAEVDHVDDTFVTVPSGHEPVPEPRVQTPEEHLAEADDPMDHESTGADIDTPMSTTRTRPPRGQGHRAVNARVSAADADIARGAADSQESAPTVTEAAPVAQNLADDSTSDGTQEAGDASGGGRVSG